MQLRSGLTLPQHQHQVGQGPPAPPPQTQAVHAASSGQEREAAFREGVRLCLQRWTALQLAVENQWGGRNSWQRAKDLGESIVAWFAARGHKRTADGTPLFYPDELEDFVDEAVLQGFNTEVDDGSLEEVSDSLFQVHEECWVGHFATVLQWQQEERDKQQTGSTSAAAASRRLQKEEDEDSDDSDDSMAGEEERAPASGHGQARELGDTPVVHRGEAQDGQLLDVSQGQAEAPGRLSGDVAMPGLSKEEAEEGWQQVPPRRSGRRR